MRRIQPAVEVTAKGIRDTKAAKPTVMNVEEGEEAKYAAEADEVGELEKFTERRDAKGEDEKAEGPVSSSMLEEFDGIGAEIALNDAPD